MTEQPTMPAFVFQRRRHVEIEAGLILAGQLIVDIPKRKRHSRMISAIIQQLTAKVASGSMPESGLVVGWHGGSRPPNAVDIDNDEIMTAWINRSVVVGVRVDPRTDGYLRIDSDAAAQMGLIRDRDRS